MKNLAVSGEMPHAVYHYCSVETFYNIIRNHTLRLSDIEKSNDFMEKKWAIHQCLDYIKCNLDNPDYPCSRSPLLARQLLESMEQQFHSYNMTILACCFSSKRDLLSQWRGYGDNGAGVSIGIDAPSRFAQAHDRTRQYFRAPQSANDLPSNLCFHKIQYSTEEIQDTVMHLFSIFLNWLPLENSIEKIAHALVRTIYPALPFFKSRAFSEESEWLCVYFPRLPAPPYIDETFDEPEFQDLLQAQKQTLVLDSFTLQPMEYRLRQRNLVPYRDLAFDAAEQPFIRSVTIGPKCPLDRETVKLFLELHGIPIPLEKICLSEISYR